MRDTYYFRDVYNDLFITHGGLFSKLAIKHYLDSTNFNKVAPTWQIIKQHVLDSVNTHDEVRERQPILADLFKLLRLGQDIKPLNREGDLLLRDFIVEVKQPASLSLSSMESSSLESNDQQLVRAMRSRKRNWGILTNASEWQFVYIDDLAAEPNAIPFCSFSVLDMIKDEENAQRQIAVFISLLTNRQFRNNLMSDSSERRSLATSSFTKSLVDSIERSRGLGIEETSINNVIALCFRLSFIFYAEDIGALPRHSAAYRKFDLRREFAQKRKIDANSIARALKAFSSQKWSDKRLAVSGNDEFWDADQDRWLGRHALLLSQIPILKLWFDDDWNELDISEISSSDLCDVYQNCVHYDSENVGTVYTSSGLSNFINHWISENLDVEIKPKDVILDPACGSGHLLKRLLFLATKLSGSASFKSKSDLIDKFCTEHLAGFDRNETAVFITKLNLWLTCVRPNKSLPPLPRIRQLNTLKHFESAFANDDLQISNFLGDLGSRVVAVISNPPWSMVEGDDHPERWISESAVWGKFKSKISGGKNNVAFNFLYLIDAILDPKGVAMVIMPGVFFVGSDCKIRDTLIDRIHCYAPMARNRDFETIDASQNYGIIGIRKKSREKGIRTYIDLDKQRVKSFIVDEEIFKMPALRKAEEPGLKNLFSADTLLPLFGSEDDVKKFSAALAKTSPIVSWTKGNKENSIKGPDLKNLPRREPAKGILLLATPENRGNSEMALMPTVLTKAEYDNCHHKVIRLSYQPTSAERSQKIIRFLQEDLNGLMPLLRTGKSIQAATLNLIGLPTKERSALDEAEIRIKKAEQLLSAKKKARRRRATA